MLNIADAGIIQRIAGAISTALQASTTKDRLRVVLQIGKKHLAQAFQLTARLRQHFTEANVEFYTLYDSMKKSCCTDIIGSRHIEPYALLFHFGYACFSEHQDSRHHYILPQIDEDSWHNFEKVLLGQEFAEMVGSEKIGAILCDQSVYEQVLSIEQQILQNVCDKTKAEYPVSLEIARLPYDAKESHSYFCYGYYLQNGNHRNILVIKPDSNFQPSPQATSDEQEPTCDLLLQNLTLSKQSLNIDKIFAMTPSDPFPCESALHENKRMMQRLSQIGELHKYKIFGILISNPSTKFCQQQITRCRAVLDHNKLKHFTFMMNNLNECKLGNFPEIEVYIVISCYNYSLYSVKDFFRLVVAPIDVEIAFARARFERYQFDLAQPQSQLLDLEQAEQVADQQQQQQQQRQLAKQSQEVVLADAIQTLEYYRSREYKGLDFSEKKEVQKIRKGKIGIAEKYTKLE